MAFRTSISRYQASGPAPVISIDSRRTGESHAAWSLLEIERPGHRSEPLGILLVDEASDNLTRRLRPAVDFADLEEQAVDILELLGEDLAAKAQEMGGARLLASLEDSLSGFFRISDRTRITYSGDPRRQVDRLFDEYVDSTVLPYVTHFPKYALRAAATKFGEGMSGEVEEWLRAPEGLRLSEDHFAVRVVGRSMEPLIPDGALCLFRANVRGTRQGKRVLIEKFDENDFSARYAVKRYTSKKVQAGDAGGEDAGWEHSMIRLEPLNPEFEAFELSPDAFRVIGEFVEVLES